MEMSSGSGVDHHRNNYNCQPRGFLTPPAKWNTNRRCSPAMPASEQKPRRSPQAKADLFHVIHKVPSGDSPYVRAKHVQLIDKDPSRAISLFWAAINSGDRVDSALKDMAVVMKQLERSDEAIEAIKSFRHLCPPDSQESLDNILVELYKQSGRIEEEIEMLQIKLKQVEEGIAFGGKRTKMARSQGKKIQITVEKEYSRLLGNLAWAYMQQKDFNSAAEHYRKALSFEPDKNKQCNLAICLMHMNKLAEAKFLLQAIRVSSENGRNNDESHVKSYERASQMLVEFESQYALNPINGTGDKNESGVITMHNGAFTEFPYEKRADFDWRKNQNQLNNQRAYESSPFCSRVIPRVPFTQPRRFSRPGDYRREGFTENAYRISSRKLSFESSTRSGENVQLLVNRNYNWSKNSSDNLDANNPSETNEEKMILCRKSDADCRKTCEVSKCQQKRSWADMVEDEQNSGSWEFPIVSSMNRERNVFNDENTNCNIISESDTPRSLLNEVEISQKLEMMDLGSGYFTQPEKITTMNQPVRRSLCFDQNEKVVMASNHCSSPLTTKVLNFEGEDLALSEDYFSNPKSMKQRNRLQVFQDITTTHVPESP